LPAAAGVLILLVAGLAWLRDSPLVGVDEVSVTGASGPDAPRIEDALRAVARDMTTLHIREDALRKAVTGFPTVSDLRVERDFPDALRIEVVEREPVAVVGVGDQRMPVTAGGTVLRGATAPDDLPLIDDSRSERLLALLGAAPKPLLRRAERAFAGDRGLTVRMSDGPEVYFGTPTDLEAKWAAAARVLADPAAEGAEYVDVRVPERTAAGGLAPIEDDEEPTEEELAPGATTGVPAPGATTPVDPAATAEGTAPVTPETPTPTPGTTP
jgi:cell division protein FtsQ